MARGTTQDTATEFVRIAAQSRPATEGNKNLQPTARRKSAFSQVPESRTSMLKGPDRGTG